MYNTNKMIQVENNYYEKKKMKKKEKEKQHLPVDNQTRNDRNTRHVVFFFLILF